MLPIATKNGEPLKRRRTNGNNFSHRFPQIVAALTVLPVRSSQGRQLFCRFSEQTPALKWVMTDDIHRTCPHCGGKNASYFIGIEETACGLRPSVLQRAASLHGSAWALYNQQWRIK